MIFEILIDLIRDFVKLTPNDVMIFGKIESLYFIKVYKNIYANMRCSFEIIKYKLSNQNYIIKNHVW